MDRERLQVLLDVGRSVVSDLDSEAVLRRVLDVARELTGARYAAIGVLNEDRNGLSRFITAGASPAVQEAIGDLPSGRGVLGLLITDPRPLRVDDVTTHPASFGFPPEHPPMHTFLGVPIVVGGRAWGNLYLTERAGGSFTEEDEEAAVVLSQWAAVAIGNARSYDDERRRAEEIERARRGLETTVEVSRALGGVTDVGRVLELVAERSRTLLRAATAEVSVLDHGRLSIAAVAGDPPEPGLAPYGDDALRTGELQRAPGALVAPLRFRGRAVGLLVVRDERPFDADDERLLAALAAGAATAVATARSATDEALRRSISASERERRRWARELHDEPLQELAGLRMLLSGARRSGDAERLDGAVGEALDLLTAAIANLRSLITDLRPASLDELGVPAAMEALAGRVTRLSGIQIELDVELPERHSADVEATIYRMVQEGLSNAVKHADARRAVVVVRETDGLIEVRVRDDGRGFDPDQPAGGFGLLGMRERLAVVRGTLQIESSLGSGTDLRAVIPLS